MAGQGEERMDAHSEAAREGEKRGFFRSLFRGIMFLAGGFLILLLTAVLLLLSSKPVDFLPTFPEDDEQVHLERAIEKFSDSVVTEDGLVAESALLVLTPQEADAVVKGVLRSIRCTRPVPHSLRFRGSWENGLLCLQGSVFRDFPPMIALNGAVKALPEQKRSGVFTLTLQSAKIGRLPVPCFVLNSLIRDKLAELRSHASVREMEAIFTEVHVLEDGSLSVAFRPRDIGRFTRFLMAGNPRD